MRAIDSNAELEIQLNMLYRNSATRGLKPYRLSVQFLM